MGIRDLRGTLPPSFRRRVPSLNPDAQSRWLGKETLAPVRLEFEDTIATLDTGSVVNQITMQYAQKRGIAIFPLAELVQREARRINLQGTGGHLTPPVGYAIARLQSPDIEALDRDVIFLVVKDGSASAEKVPVILGVPGLQLAISLMTETELLELLHPQTDKSKGAEAWSLVEGALIMGRNLQSRAAKVRTDVATKPIDPLLLEEVLVVKAPTTVPAFSTAVVPVRTDFCLTGYSMNVMTGPAPEQEGATVSGLHISNAYMELKPGSYNLSVVVRNKTGAPIRLAKKRKIGKVYAANAIPTTYRKPELEVTPDDLEETPTSRATQAEREQLLKDQLDLEGLKSWSPAHAQAAKDLLSEFNDCFSLEKDEMGEVPDTTHTIRLKPDTEPFKERFRRIPPHMVEEVRKTIQEMLDSGTIRPSESPWCNAVVLVRKGDGSLRFCVDFRRLNEATLKDSHPLPRVSEALDTLVGSEHFSSLDLKSGFWQVPMDPESKKYTAFTAGDMGFFEFNRMPFGLCNAPATFQRCMVNCLGELNLVYAIIYLDDIVVFSDTEEEHLIRLRKVFEKIREQQLKLKPSKCNLFRRSTVYLGHLVSGAGIQPDPKNVEVIKNYPEPTNYTELRGFLGVAGHYRRFIKGYSKIANPLTQRLTGTASSYKQEPLTLEADEVKAMEHLKTLMTQAPVLAYADFTKPFLLETDASALGLGAVISQKGDDNRYHPVAFASKTLDKAQKNYHSSKLEFLALKWAVDHFKEFLRHKPFVVRTDNNPLTYIMTTPNLTATGHRWVSELASYEFSLEYQKGVDNSVADALSRLPCRLDTDGVKTIFDGAVTGSSGRAEASAPEIQEEADQNVIIARSAAAKIADEDGAAGSLPMHPVEWSAEQRADPALKEIIDWLKTDKAPAGDLLRRLACKIADCSEKEARIYYAVRKAFKLHKGLLYLRRTPKNEVTEFLAFVVPRARRRMALDGCHRDAGHQGQQRTLELVSDRFWWPYMSTDVKNVVKNCKRCLQHESKALKPPMVNIVVSAPLELVHVDFTSIETTVELNKPPKIKNVLVVTDHFTRFSQAFVTKDQKAKTLAKVLYERFFAVFGSPARLMSDRGANFTSALLKEMCNLLQITHCKTTPYHPQSNGQVERFHQTLTRMIGKLARDHKANWEEHLPELTQAYNATRSAVTGFSPHYLMYGRRPRLPVDFLFPTVRPTDRPRVVTEYTRGLAAHLKQAYGEAMQYTTKEAARQKRQYDRATCQVVLQPGDKVLLKNDAYQGRRKIMDRWGEEIWEIVRQLAPDVPSYELKGPNGETKQAHRHRLLQIPDDQDSVLMVPSASTNVAGVHEEPATDSQTEESAARDEMRPNEVNCPQDVENTCRALVPVSPGSDSAILRWNNGKLKLLPRVLTGAPVLPES